MRKIMSAPSLETEQIDSDVARAYPCDECGSQMDYRGESEYDEDGRLWSYRAFCFCTNPDCDVEYEF
jgi:hypothetical protein